MTTSIVLWLVVAVVVCWLLGAYNRLVRLRAQVISVFAAVDHRMTQSLVLMGEAVAQSQSQLPAEPDATSGAAGSANRAALQAAAIQFEVALRVAGKHPLDANGVAALQTAYATAHAVWERYLGDAADNASVAQASVRRTWEDNTQAVRDAEAGYNVAMLAYNAAIAQFPASILAYLFGFTPGARL